MDEIAAQIRTSLDGNGIDMQIASRMILSPTPPTIDIYPTDPSDDQTLAAFNETYEYGGELLTVRARVSTADTDTGEELLLAFMDDEDPLSISEALSVDPTLNGLGRLTIRSRSGYRDFPLLDREGTLLGCLWQLVVIKAHS